MATVDDQVQTMIANLPEKTGKTLDQWLSVVAGSNLDKHGAIVKMLKTEYGMTHGFANLVAHQALKPQTTDGGAQLDTQYAGPKAALRPVYDAVITAVQGFGKDVEVAPKKTYVSLRRKKQFALVQPSTKTRVDLGINLKGAEPAGRLEASGSFNAMVSHRVRLESPEDVDHDVVGWLKQAYDSAG